MPTLRRMLNGNGSVVIAHLAGHGLERLQVGEQVADVLDLRALVGRVGKGRKIMRAGWRGALDQGGDEIGLGPVPDTVSAIGRNVGNVECPERRCQGKPAAKLQPIGLIRHRVAGGTSARVEHCKAVGEIGRMGRQRLRQDDGRYCQPPENRNASHRSDNETENTSSQHSPIRHFPIHLQASMAVIGGRSSRKISRDFGPERE